MHPALFYRPGERLSLTELTAARLDGHVVELGEGYLAADTIEGPDARAQSIAGLVPLHAAASGRTAAWIHGAGDQAPGIHHVTRTTPTRQRSTVSVRVAYHDRRLAPGDVQRLGGILVATPLSTAALLLFDAASVPGDEHWLRALVAAQPQVLPQLRDMVGDISRRPGARHARALLAELVAAQEVVTRYTS